jgi:hypothetical protein
MIIQGAQGRAVQGMGQNEDEAMGGENEDEAIMGGEN